MNNQPTRKKLRIISEIIANMSGKGESINLDLLPILFFVIGIILLILLGFSIFVSNLLVN